MCRAPDPVPRDATVEVTMNRDRDGRTESWSLRCAPETLHPLRSQSSGADVIRIRAADPGHDATDPDLQALPRGRDLDPVAGAAALDERAMKKLTRGSTTPLRVIN